MPLVPTVPPVPTWPGLVSAPPALARTLAVWVRPSRLVLVPVIVGSALASVMRAAPAFAPTVWSWFA